MSRGGVLAYVAAFGAVGGLLVAAWLGPAPWSQWRHWQPPEAQAPNRDDIRAAALHRHVLVMPEDAQTLERPIFNPSRSPRPLVTQSPAQPKAPPPPNFIEESTLQGVLHGGTLEGVMLTHQDDAHFVRLGDSVQGWKLIQVSARRAVFEQGGKQQEILFDIDTRSSEPANSSGAPTGALDGASAVLVTPAPAAADEELDE